MAQRTSYERALSDISAFEFEEIADERRRLDPGAYTALTTIENNEGAAETPTLIELDQPNRSSSTDPMDDSTKHDEPRAHATLKRSALHEWISTIFDAFMSLVPLFFLGAYLRLKVR